MEIQETLWHGMQEWIAKRYAIIAEVKSNPDLIQYNFLEKHDFTLIALFEGFADSAHRDHLDDTEKFLIFSASALKQFARTDTLKGIGRSGEHAWERAIDHLSDELVLSLNGHPSRPITPIEDLRLRSQNATRYLVLNNGVTTIGMLLHLWPYGEASCTLSKRTVREIQARYKAYKLRKEQLK